MKKAPFVILLASLCGLGDLAAGRVRAAPATQPAGRAAATRPASRPAAPRGAATIDVGPNQPFLHEATGFTFPPTVGSFRRVQVGQLDEAQRGVLVRYKDPDLKIALTVAVYPGGGVGLGPAFSAVRASLLNKHPKARLTNEGKWTLHQHDADAAGMRMTYEYIDMYNEVEQDLEAQACLVPLAGGGNYVRYDAIYPAADAKAARGRAGWFMEMLKLPAETKAAG
jgi:hypothetical protein